MGLTRWAQPGRDCRLKGGVAPPSPVTWLAAHAAPVTGGKDLTVQAFRRPMGASVRASARADAGATALQRRWPLMRPRERAELRVIEWQYLNHETADASTRCV
jgi:hypothetical protein